jgi:hypothetical protein
MLISWKGNAGKICRLNIQIIKILRISFEFDYIGAAINLMIYLALPFVKVIAYLFKQTETEIVFLYLYFTQK